MSFAVSPPLTSKALTNRADGMRIRAISSGQALAHAQSIIKSGRTMTWQLVKENEKPRIMWARVAQVHEDTEVGQVAVRFDTEQVRPISLSSTTDPLSFTAVDPVPPAEPRDSAEADPHAIGLDIGRPGQTHDQAPTCRRKLCV